MPRSRRKCNPEALQKRLLTKSEVLAKIHKESLPFWDLKCTCGRDKDSHQDDLRKLERRLSEILKLLAPRKYAPRSKRSDQLDTYELGPIAQKIHHFRMNYSFYWASVVAHFRGHSTSGNEAAMIGERVLADIKRLYPE